MMNILRVSLLLLVVSLGALAQEDTNDVVAKMKRDFVGAYDSYSLEDFFQVVATKGGWPYSQVSPFIQTLRNNWYGTIPSLRGVSDSQYQAMNIPLGVASVIKNLAWTPRCPNVCKHGGTPNGDCTSCTGCLGGWTGTFCDQYQGGDINVLLQGLRNIGVSALQHYQSLSQYQPIPNQIGLGVDITTGKIKLPIVQLTYDVNDNIHTYTDCRGNRFRLPQQAVFDPISTGQDNPYTKTIVMKTVSDYISTMFSWSNGQTGLAGFFSNQQNVESIFQNYFVGGFSLAIEQRMYPAYKFTLPADPVQHARVYELDEYAQAAIDYLPPAYDTEDNKALWRLFVENWGTGYTVESYNGGIVEMVSSFTADLFSISINGQYITPTDVARYVDIEFLQSLGMHNGDGQVQAYIERRSLKSFGCAGGDVMKCQLDRLNPGYTDTINFNPVPLVYTVADIGELITDPGKKSAFQQAVQALIQDYIIYYQNLNTCPTCQWGSCARPSSVCTCENSRIIGIRCNMCAYGWAGDHCNSPTCGTGCVHGTCVSPDVCQCQDHWQGAHCETCTPQWSGSNCQNPVCAPSCQHGTCSAPNKCSCQTHWDGSACEHCLHGWSGSTCSVGKACFMCGGSGKVCNSLGCQYGYVTCPSCLGSTQIPSDVNRCYRCGGSGSVCNSLGCEYGKQTCPGCSGKGYVCPTCSKCPKCYGSGTVCNPLGCIYGTQTCGTCRGYGYIN